MNECREAFEKWCEQKWGGYPIPTLDKKKMWEAWQAAWNYKEKSDEA